MGTDSLSGLDIVIVGQQAWDTDIGSNCKNIALEFSKSHRVLYVNSPLDRVTRYRSRSDAGVKRRVEVIHGQSDGVVPIQENLWNLYPDCLVESINWLNNPRLFNWFNLRNNRRFARSIQRALSELKFDHFILFNDNEIIKAFYLNKLLNPKLSVYYSRDFMLAVDYWKKHGQVLEPMLIANNDLTVANSEYLADYCRKYNPHAYYVGQGCDLGLFNSDAVEKVGVLPRRDGEVRIGYVGAINELRLDVEVLRFIAQSRPNWTLVLVGPESEFFLTHSGLHELPNVVFTGKQPPEQLSAYIQTFDVCINPQLINDVTIGNYPRKIDEYLAMGKPVVATHTRAMDIFNDYVYLCTTKEDYIKQIGKALTEDSDTARENRRAFAATHTWENSVNAIKTAMANHI